MTFGLDPSREFKRSQNFKVCEERGYHVGHRPDAIREEKVLGGEKVEMELCRLCDVWVEPSKFLHDDLYEEFGY